MLRQSKTLPIAVLDQLATCLSRGLSMHYALTLVAEAQSSKRIRRDIMTIRGHVVSGMSFTDAVTSTYRCRPYALLVLQTHEHVGNLALGMSVIVAEESYRKRLRALILGSMAYPVTLLCGVGVLAFIVVQKAVPIFFSIGMMHNNLPLPTKILLWIASHGLLMVGIFCLAVIVIIATHILLRKKNLYQYTIHYFTLYTYGVRSIYRAQHTYIILAVIAWHIKAGLSLIEALGALEKVYAGYIRRCIALFSRKIQQGGSLTEMGLFFPFLSKSFTSELKIAEVSGTFSQFVERASLSSRDEYIQILEKMQKALIPICLVFCACFVLLVSAALLMPMYQMSQLMYAH